MSGRRPPQPPAPAPSSGWVVLLSVIAIVVSLVAITFTVLRGGTATADVCRTLAWDALPDGSGLPAGWTVTAGNFYADGAGDSLVGPPTDDGSPPETLYLQVTCYGADGHLAMTHSHQSALAAGASEADPVDLGDESFSTQDPSNGSTSVYVRRGGLVAVVVAPSTVDPDDLQQAALAVDTALSLAGSTAVRPVPTVRPPVSSPTGGVDLPTDQVSEAPSASDEPIATDPHEAPGLEALLPKAVAGVTLTRRSITGTEGLTDTDPSSQALIASLTKLGKTPADLQIAVATDESQSTDLQVSAFQLPGIKGSTLGQALVESYLAAAPSGISSATKTISGRVVTQVMYHDTYPDDYVYVHGDVVFDVATSDPASAIQALAALP